MSTTVGDVAAWMDRFAPGWLAESWDNVGLLWGDPCAPLTRVMTCLTVTEETAREAIEKEAGLIVSHHPVLFKAVQRVTAVVGDPSAALWKLARAGVAVYSPHTAFDNCGGGINDLLAERLELVDVGPLKAAKWGGECKVVVFLPEGDREKVLEAAFRAGGGRIGAYRECSFEVAGRGTFFGGEGSSPSVGEAGRREQVEESRLEVVVPEGLVGSVVAAIRRAHSYEEPAVDVYPLKGVSTAPGIGRVGRLPEPEGLGSLAGRVGELLGSKIVHYAGEADREVSRLAIACGAGDSFLTAALSAGVDALLTGEARYHRAVEAAGAGLGLIAAGHHATERIGVESLAGRLAVAFPGAEVFPSHTERDPWNAAGGKG